MSTQDRHELAVIDSQIDDYQTLVDAAQADGMEVILLSGDDGIEELADTLPDQTDIDALHLFTHGSQGQVQIGDDSLNSTTLADYADELELIKGSLSEEGDILLYGCNVAEGETGEDFIERLALITGADIAASDDLTGNSKLGGDWELEATIGYIEAQNQRIEKFDSLLAYTGSINFSEYIANSGGYYATDNAEFTVALGAYKLIVDGADAGIYENNGSEIAAVPSGYTESKVTFSFSGNESFDVTSIYIKNNVGSPSSETFVITSDKSDTFTTNAYAVGSGANISLTGFTGITKLYVTTSDGAFEDIYFDNMVVANLGAASNTAPTISNVTSTAQPVNDNATLNPFSTVTIDDGDGDNVTVSIQLDQNYGSFSNYLGQGFTYDSGTLTYSLASGAVGDAETAIQGLIFDPRENSIASGTTETTTFTITVNDGTAADVTNSDTKVTTTSVNDAPTDISLSSSSINQSEGTNGTVGTLSSTDVDANESFTYTLVSGTGNTDNDSFNISGDTLRADNASGLTEGTYDIRISTSDGDTTYEEAFTITVVDNVAPTVTSIDRQTPSNSSTNADTLTWRVTFSEDVTNIDTSDFSLSGTTASISSVSGVSGSASVYDVTASGGDLANFDGTVTLSFGVGQNITDSAGSPNALSNTTPTGTNNASYTLDNTGPSVTSVSSTKTNGTYKTGEIISIQVVFDDTVTVAGTPQLTLETGTTDRTIDYAGGSSSDTLTFNYTVQSGDLASDLDYASVNALTLNSGTIKDSTGNDATLTLPTPGAANSLSNNKALVIDAVAPVISSVSIPNTSMAISDAVTVSIAAGEAGLTLDSGTINGIAVTGFTDDGGGSYHATYTVASGHIDRSAGDDIPVSFVLADAAGNKSTAYTTAISQASDSIDATLPLISGALSPSISTITDTQVGTDTFTLTVNFDEAMDTSVNPALAFPTSAEIPSNTLAFSSGSWEDNATYVATYNVADANEVIRNIDVQVFGAKDAAGNTLSVVTQNDIFSVITAPAPVLSSLSSTTSTGTYKVGQSVNITITFDKAVDFTATGGTLQVTLNTGATVDLASSDATNQTSFSGTYTISEGETDTSDLAITSVSLTGSATLEANSDQVPANLGTLPSGSNISDSKDIVIDANTPAVSAPDLDAASDTGTSDTDNLTNNATATISGSGTEVGSSVSIRVGASEVGTTTVDGSGNWTYTFGTGELSTGANTVNTIVTDTAGNASVVSSDLTITLDTTAPTASNDTTATIGEDDGDTTLTSLNGSGNNINSNDTGASSTTPVVKVSGDSAKVGASVAGDNGGLFTVNADGTVKFNPNDEFNSVASGSTKTSSVTVTVQDDAGNTADSTLTVTVNGANDAPTAADATKSVSYNGTYTFSAADFGFSDVDTGDTLDSIEIVTLPTVGSFQVDGVDVSANEVISAANIGNLTFTPESGGTGNDYASFTFTVNDNTIDSVSANTITMNVGSRPSSSTPTETTTQVDGATQTTTTEQDSQGNTIQVVTVAPVTPSRQNTDSTSTGADVPFQFLNNDPNNVVTTLSLPTGLGARVLSNSTANTQNQATNLINLIQGTGGDSEESQEAQNSVNNFISNSGSNSNIWVNSVTLNGSASSGNSPVLITGSSDTTHREAVVIDTRTVTGGAHVQLDNIEYSFVSGSATITGGAGENYVHGDDANQFIRLGADDDELHGGGGNDTIGSQGGDDLLFGDSGDDIVFGGTGHDTLYGGIGNDVLQGGQSTEGTLSFSLNDNGDIVTQFTPTDAGSSDIQTLSFSGDWYSQASIILDGQALGLDLSEDNIAVVLNTGLMLQATAEYAFLAMDADRLQMIASSYQSIFGELVTASDLTGLAGSSFSMAELAYIAIPAWLAQQEEGFSELSAEQQVSTLLSSFWLESDVTDAAISEVLTNLANGLSVVELFLSVAQSQQAKDKLTTDQGLLQLTATDELGETSLATEIGNDTLYGGDGNDTLIGGHGDDVIDGGDGIDTALQQHLFAQYDIAQQEGGSITLTYQQGAYTEVDTLIGVEWVQFGDRLISTDDLF